MGKRKRRNKGRHGHSTTPSSADVGASAVPLTARKRDTEAEIEHCLPELSPPADIIGAVSRFSWHLTRMWEQTKSGNLVHLTLIYLALPMLTFLFGWLRLLYALPLAAGMITLIVYWGARTRAEYRPPRRTIIICGIASLLWIGISGVGGFGFQMTDWPKHNAVLNALTFLEWPAMIGPDASLIYALGWYAPAALFGKLFGFTGTNLFLFAWTFLGFWMITLWFLHHAGGGGANMARPSVHRHRWYGYRHLLVL